MQRDGKWGVQSVHSHFVCCFSTSSASFLPDLGDCTNAPHIFFPSFSACVHYFFSPFLNTCSPRCHHLVCLAQLCSAVGLLEPTGSGCLAEENPGLFSQMPPPKPPPHADTLPLIHNSDIEQRKSNISLSSVITTWSATA